MSETRAAERSGQEGGERRAHELAVLYAVAEALNSSSDVQQALERTLALVADLLGLRTGWIWLLDGETGQFYLAAAQNLPPYLQAPLRMSGRWCYCTSSFREGRLHPSNIDMLECSRLRAAVEARTPELTLGLRYHASIPLYFQERGLGIMNIAGPSWRELTADELRLLSTIAYQVGIAVERARLAEASARLARAEERTRIAREIHDTLAQGLTAIGLDIEGALRHLTSNPDEARIRLERALGTARDSLEEARRSVLDLRSTPLAGRPLAQALRALARAFTSETGVRVHVQAAGLPELPLRTEAELYRIVQEALTNVRKHADATQVTVVLRAGNGHLSLLVRDDGAGFAPEPAGSGHGILGMRERARLLGGRLRLRSRPGRGTTVSLRLNLELEVET
ncbi:MAG TPA: GAF domain-containing sensor histidine kinase [Thermomicrobiaceae bacterium]|nr:GAF domain-containing sensor histidine kinase [Thermomicrobiaceae bacterium]